MSAGKVFLFSVFATIGAIGAILGFDLIVRTLLSAIAPITGVENLGAWATLPLLALLIWLFPRTWLAWNRKYECHGSTVIETDIDTVWRKIELTAREEYFTPAISEIRRSTRAQDEFEMVFAGSIANQMMPPSLHVQLVDQVRHEYLGYRTLNAHEMPLFGKDHLMTEILLSQEDDGVKVTFIETLSRITLASFLGLLFMNPARDGLKSLKAQIEGTPDVSVMAEIAQDIGPDIEEPAEITRAIWISGITAAVITTVQLTALMIFLA